MPSIKQIAIAFGVALAATIITGFVAFLSEVHLEISFDKLKDFNATDLASYARLGAAVRFDLETASPQEFTAYWVDDDEGKPVIRKSDISYKNFHLNNRISGELVDEDDHATFAITGYYNSNRIVFSHRGPISGTGIYILDSVQVDGITAPVYAGYAILEEVKRSGSSETWILQCPFIMIDADAAAKKVASIDAARTTFSFLNGRCTSFNMPHTVTTASAQH